MAAEIDKGTKEIDEILKKRKQEVMAVGESNANKNLKDILKDLGKKKR